MVETRDPGLAGAGQDRVGARKLVDRDVRVAEDALEPRAARPKHGGLAPRLSARGGSRAGGRSGRPCAEASRGTPGRHQRLVVEELVARDVDLPVPAAREEDPLRWGASTPPSGRTSGRPRPGRPVSECLARKSSAGPQKARCAADIRPLDERRHVGRDVVREGRSGPERVSHRGEKRHEAVRSMSGKTIERSRVRFSPTGVATTNMTTLAPPQTRKNAVRALRDGRGGRAPRREWSRSAPRHRARGAGTGTGRCSGRAAPPTARPRSLRSRR